jgi:hypothetical protein
VIAEFLAAGPNDIMAPNGGSWPRREGGGGRSIACVPFVTNEASRPNRYVIDRPPVRIVLGNLRQLETQMGYPPDQAVYCQPNIYRVWQAIPRQAAGCQNNEKLLDKIKALQDQNSHLEKYVAQLSDEHFMKTAKIEQELKNSQARVLQLSLKLVGV